MQQRATAAGRPVHVPPVVREVQYAALWLGSPFRKRSPAAERDPQRAGLAARFASDGRNGMPGCFL